MTDATRESEGSAPADRGGYSLLVAWIVGIASVLAAATSLRPPSPRGQDAPATEFSAARAERVLRELAGDGSPRPLGSASNAAACERVAAAFRDVGLEVTVEDEEHVFRGAGHVRLRNVVARLGGSGGGPPIAVVSHHDSVAAGPGIADDLMSVAASVETARALRAGAPLRRDVVFLVTDGEEAGLLGAILHSGGRKPDYAAVVNLEARGNRGPVFMFETGPRSRAAVGAWAAEAARPLTSSLFAGIYAAMPNDTDFTVFRAREIPGLNFACIGRVQHYHTPLDDLANLDRRTLQHLGENALAAVRGLDGVADATLSESPEAAWFDVLGRFVAIWDLGTTRWLAIAAVLGVAAAVAAAVGRARFRARELLGATGAVVAAVLAGVAAANGGGAALGECGAASIPFVASPHWGALASSGLALAAGMVVWALLARWIGPFAAALATWLVVGVAGAALAFAAPVAAHLLVVPALVAVPCGIAAALSGRTGWMHVPLAVSVLLWAPLALLLPGALEAEVLGFPPWAPSGHVALVAGLPWCAATAIPSRRRWIGVLAAAAAGVVGFALATTVPAATPELPQRLSFVRVADEATPHAHVFLRTDGGTVPREVRDAFEFEDEPDRILPWEEDRAPVLEGAAARIEAPRVEDLRTDSIDGGRRLRFRIVSQRGASDFVVALAPKTRVRRVVVAGREVPPEFLRSARSDPWVLRSRAAPRRGLVVELDLEGRDASEAYVADRTDGLPPEDAPLLRARPATSVPSHEGDVTWAVRRLRL